MRLRRIAKRVSLVDLDLDAPLLNEREQLGGARFERSALADEVLQRRSRHVQRAAPHQLVQTERLDLARRVTEAHENGVRAQAIERLIERREAERVVDDENGADREIAEAARYV